MKKFILSFALLMAWTAMSAESGLDAVRASFVKAAAAGYTPNEEMARQFIECSNHGKANDVLLLQLYDDILLPDDEVEYLLSLFTEEGCFSDIDYTDKTRGRWDPTCHLTRLYSLLKLYANPESSWYRSEKLIDLAHKAVAFWCENKPTSLNWWHQEIGVPKKLATILLLMGDQLTAEEIEAASPVLLKAKFGRTGQNKVWLAANNLMRGLIIDDPELVLKGRDTIAEEIVMGDGEGIRPDWSFHQHGPQIQLGNYGLAFCEGVSFFIRALAGTEYAFSDEQVEILSSLVLNSTRWTFWRGIMDPSYCGRQHFLNAGRGKAYTLAVIAQNLAEAGTPARKQFLAISDENLDPANHPNTLTGAVYFPYSDCGVYRGKDWYASIRMHSDRTIGFEFTNRENLGAWFAADGAILFMQSSNEYENIFGHWDWRKVPGVTAYDDGKPQKDKLPSNIDHTNESAHVGGLADGNCLCATIEVNRDSTHALKSSFFFKDLVVALGTDISTTIPAPVKLTTALDQVNYVSEYQAGEGWAWHDDRGYVTLGWEGVKKADLQVSDAVQTGLLDIIDPFYVNVEQSGRVFKCWIDHAGTVDESYAYALLPHRDAAQTARFAEKPAVKVLRNDTSCQAVRYKGITMAVLHEAGRYKLGCRTFKVSEPTIVIRGRGHRASQLVPAPEVVK